MGVRPGKSRWLFGMALTVASLPAAAQQIPGPGPEARPPVGLLLDGRTEDQLASLPRLGAAHPHERASAAEELCSEGETPIAAAPALLAALRRETYPKPFGAMLRALGGTGIREARPIIDAHLDSDNGDLRDAAREALKLWLVRNGLLWSGADLPDPAPRDDRVPLTRQAPAAYSLEQLTGVPAPPSGATPPAPTLERQSSAARVGGLVALPVGGAMVLFGVLVILSGQHVGTCCGGPSTGERESTARLGGLLAAGGAAAMGLGGGMIYYGSQWVPRGQQPGERAPPAPVRGHNVGVRWRF